MGRVARAVDRVLGEIAPSWALRRAAARARLELLEHYAAARRSPNRAWARDEGSGRALAWHYGRGLRDLSRRLERDDPTMAGVVRHLAGWMLDTTIMPAVKDRSGKLVEPTNLALAEAFARWRNDAEASGLLGWAALMRQLGCAAVRDGETWSALIEASPRYPYPGDVPLAIAPFEADHVDYDFNADAPLIRYGVELGEAGRVQGWHLFREHPGDASAISWTRSLERVRYPREVMLAAQFLPRAGMLRGVTPLAPVLTTIQHQADYLEAELVAAKFAACLGVQITRQDGGAGSAPAQTLTGQATGKGVRFQPGMVFDDLLPGEEVKSVGVERPNEALPEFVRAQARRISVGSGALLTAVSADYEGSYSAMRQQLAESLPRQRAFHELGVAAVHSRIWAAFVRSAVLAGLVPATRVDPATWFDADYLPPAQPWIDPAKEVQADLDMIDGGLESRHGVIRRRGGDPRRIDAERSMDTQPGTRSRPAVTSSIDDNQQGAQA